MSHVDGVLTLSETETGTRTGTRTMGTIGLGPCPVSGVMQKLPQFLTTYLLVVPVPDPVLVLGSVNTH